MVIFPGFWPKKGKNLGRNGCRCIRYSAGNPCRKIHLLVGPRTRSFFYGKTPKRVFCRLKIALKKHHLGCPRSFLTTFFGAILATFFQSFSLKIIWFFFTKKLGIKALCARHFEIKISHVPIIRRNFLVDD